MYTKNAMTILHNHKFHSSTTQNSKRILIILKQKEPIE